MVASFHDLTLFQYHDCIGVSDRRESVGNDKYRSALHDSIHSLLNEPLCSCINRACCFIQNQYRRLGNRSSCNCDQLLLPLERLLPSPYNMVSYIEMVNIGKRIGLICIGYTIVDQICHQHSAVSSLIILPVSAMTLCEIEITVLFSLTLFKACKTALSVSASRFAVISSSSNSFGSAAAARAMDNSCHCPCEKSSGVHIVS